MIYRISQITLIVKDLEKSTELMKFLFGAKEIYSSREKIHSISKEKYFLINDLWIALMEGDTNLERKREKI
jgi:fosfomycin resistance protein FosX